METLAVLYLDLVDHPLDENNDGALAGTELIEQLFEDINKQTIFISSKFSLFILMVILSIMGMASETVALIKQGDRSPEVTTIQQQLRQLGYFQTTPTGYFGSITKDAVTRFQQRQGLSTDGIVGIQTQTSLANLVGENSGIIQNASNALKLGVQGDRVRQLQEQLGVAGFYKGTADGVFGSLTEEAVKNFQQAKGLTVDGVVGSQTQAALPAVGGQIVQSNAVVGNTTSNIQVANSAINSSVLKMGAQGDRVRLLQRQLGATGFYNGSADGVFGSLTEEAVKKFQQQQGLTVDGVVGSQTQAALPAVGGSVRENTVANDTNSNFQATASSGVDVKKVQQRLQTLGYFRDPATGEFDLATQEAVKQFQRDNRLRVDGQVGFQTLSALNAPMSKETVKQLQERLRFNGFYQGQVDGLWGPQTQRAVEIARDFHGLRARDLL